MTTAEGVALKAPRSQGFAAMFLLGVTITVVEFPTEFPYLEAIGILNSLNLYEARETMLWIVGIVGFLLLADALNRPEVFSSFSG